MTSTPKPLRRLYDEHESISAVLHALQYLVREVARGKTVDTRVFRQILYYLDVFPERFHHPKEDALLFKAVRARTHEADEVIARLERQHERGADAIRELEQSLLRWEAGGTPERDAFVHAATEFVARYAEHMRIEEDELMPLARRTLDDAEWAEVESAFEASRDPLHGVGADADPQEMFRRVLYLAPPPIGLGEPA
jgi:hemerythrin-like domain-containing protein